MKLFVLCDYRENYKNYSLSEQGKLYSDHPNQQNIAEIISSANMLGYDCKYFGGIPELIHAVNNHDEFPNSLFLNFTDGMDEDYSRVQAPVLLDILRVPYSGSEVFPSVLMNNKHFCKQALKNSDILMAKSCIVNKLIPINEKELLNWNFPLFVKPNCEGSSLGISNKSVCHTMDEVKKECAALLNDFAELIIEEFVSGIDVTNYLIGNKNSYIINDVITSELFDQSPYAVYGINEKQNKLRTLYFNEEYLPIHLLKDIQEKSIIIAQIIGVRDICRIDYRVDLATNKIYFIEINSAPRFSSTSEIGFIAQKRNLSFTQMVQCYIDAVLQRIS